MSVSGWSNEELAALGKRLGGLNQKFGEQTLGTALTALALANRSAEAMTYTDWNTSPIELTQGLNEAHIAKIMLDHQDWTAKQWAGNLLYNCVTNSGTDFAPANYRALLMEAASKADAEAEARPGLDATDKLIIATARFHHTGNPAADGATGFSIRQAAPTATLDRPKPEQVPFITTADAIAQIRAGLKARSKTPWSVSHDTGTASGWITITIAPRLRGGPYGYMTAEQRAELAKLLGLETVHSQGYSIASSSGHYWEAIDRAAGRTPRTYGEQYWD